VGTKVFNGYEATHVEGAVRISRRGKEKTNAGRLVGTKSPGKTIIYTIKIMPNRTAYVYECLVVEKSQRKFASETLEGSEPLSRAEVEKLPKFVKLLAGTLTL
jgi:hypothetical protein